MGIRVKRRSKIRLAQQCLSGLPQLAVYDGIDGHTSIVEREYLRRNCALASSPRVFFVRVANKGVMVDVASKSGGERT